MQLFCSFGLKAQVLDAGKIVFCAKVVFEDNNKDSLSASVLVLSPDKKDIYTFLSGVRTNFCVNLPRIFDSVFIVVSHVGYIDDTLIFRTNSNDIGSKIVLLRRRYTEIESVIVSPKKIEKKGDTIIFAVDSFLTGNELKLRDVVSKMPGFTIGRNGQLLYNNREVKQIFIDGKDLLSDRVSTLTDEIPVSALQSIEAIDNFQRERMLKGMVSGSDLVLNLKLKKKRRIRFGDLNSTLYSTKRIDFNQTFFSVGKKRTYALINDLNSTGSKVLNVIGYYPEEFLAFSSVEYQNKLLNTIQSIDQFDSRRYILNNYARSQLQGNIPLSRNLDIQLEGLLARDKAMFSRINSSLLVLPSSIVKQADSFSASSIPISYEFKSKLEYRIDSLSEIKFRYISKSSANSSRFNNKVDNFQGYFFENGDLKSAASNSIAILEYNFKRSNYFANFFELKFFSENYQSSYISSSSSWKKVFDQIGFIAEYGKSNVRSSSKGVLVSDNVYFKFKGKVRSVKLSYLKGELDKSSQFGLLDSTKIKYFGVTKFVDTSKISLDFFSAKSFYDFKLIRRLFVVRIEAGIQKARTRTRSRDGYTISSALVEIGVSSRRSYGEKNFDNFLISFSQKPSFALRFVSAYIPTGLNEFSRNRSVSFIKESILSSYSFTHVNSDFSTISLSAFSLVDLNSVSGIPTYEYLLKVKDDTAINRVNWFCQGSVDYTFPSLILGAKVKSGIQYSFSRNILSSQNKFIYIFSRRRVAFLEFHRKYKKAGFINFSARGEYWNNLIKSDDTAENGSSSFSFTSSIEGARQIFNNLIVEADLQTIYNSNKGSQEMIYNFLDFKIKRSFPKKGLFLIFGANNVFNIDEYSSTTSFSGNSVSSTLVPITGRMIFGSAHFNF